MRFLALLNCLCGLGNVDANGAGLDGLAQECVAHTKVHNVHCHKGKHFGERLLEKYWIRQLCMP